MSLEPSQESACAAKVAEVIAGALADSAVVTARTPEEARSKRAKLAADRLISAGLIRIDESESQDELA